MLVARAKLGELARFEASGAAGNGTVIAYEDRGRPTTILFPVVREPTSLPWLQVVARGVAVDVTLSEMPRGELAIWAQSGASLPWGLVQSVGLGGAYVDAASCTLTGGQGGTHAEILRRIARALTLPAASSLTADLTARRDELVAAYSARPTREQAGKGSSLWRNVAPLLGPLGRLGAVEDAMLEAMQTASDFLIEVASA